MTENNLQNQKCEACSGEVPKLSDTELQELIAKLPTWEIIEKDGIKRLLKAYSFKNYPLAVNFANEVAQLAEASNHHPAILLEWGKVTVEWWTHKLLGLHKNDFICAAKSDEIFTSLK